MRLLWEVLFLLVALGLTPATSAADGQKHLFILSGQSNMERLQEQRSFTPTVVAALGEENVIVVKWAQGGKPIRCWYKKWQPATGKFNGSTGEIYDKMMEEVKAVMAGKTFDTVTFVWMQGESDGVRHQGDVYDASLRGLIAQLAHDLGRDDLFVVIGRISDYAVERPDLPAKLKKQCAHWQMVRDAQVAIAESNPRYAWVDTDDLNDVRDENGNVIGQDLHLTADGYRALGLRFAEKALDLIQGTGSVDAHPGLSEEHR